MDESDFFYPAKSEREHPHDNDEEGTDIGKTEREKQDDTDVNQSDSGKKGQDELDESDEDHHSTFVPWNFRLINMPLFSSLNEFLMTH